MALAELDALARGRDVEAGDQDALDTGDVGGGQDRVAVLLEG